MKNLSLARTASSLAIFVPVYMGEDNINYIYKQESDPLNGGEDLTIRKPFYNEMKGKGNESIEEKALQHPIKVLNIV